MSYDVHLEDQDGAELGWRNHTSNCSGMWTRALQLPERPWLDEEGRQRTGRAPDGQGGWREVPLSIRGLKLLDGAPAVEAAGLLTAAVERMAAAPAEYEPMKPGNGWGDYEGALAFLRWCAELCAAHPAAVLRVSN